VRCLVFGRRRSGGVKHSYTLLLRLHIQTVNSRAAGRSSQIYCSPKQTRPHHGEEAILGDRPGELRYSARIRSASVRQTLNFRRSRTVNGLLADWSWRSTVTDQLLARTRNVLPCIPPAWTSEVCGIRVPGYVGGGETHREGGRETRNTSLCSAQILLEF